MQKLTLLFLFGMLFSSAFPQISPTEKEALKALYDATNGPNWISETDADPSNNWDFSGPVTADWFGIFMLEGRLETVRLYRNNLDGYIPESIGNLFNLKRLYLDSNNLSGTLPESLGNLTKLETLYASSNNLSGPIPQSLGRLNNIKGIQIEYNALEGPIPEKLGEAPNLTLLYLSSNQLSGPIPESLGYNIAELLLDNNQLTGSIPESFSRPGRPWFALAVNNNQLEGKIPDYFSRGNYRHLRFANNRFEFGGFEENFDDYKDNYYQFQYTPQAKVNEIELQNRVNGTATIMVTNCSGAQNRYQWFKGGVALMDGGTISGAQTDTLNIVDLGNGDNGVYHCEVTSDIVTDLTLVRNDITLNVGCSTPVADDLEDSISCESYTLPVLSKNNKYFTATHGGGTQLNAGDVITNSQTIYIYAGTNGCSDESSFTVTVESPVVVNTLGDVQVCENYMLPVLDQGNYYTEFGGQGTELFSGDSITVSQTVYIYFELGSCSDESRFTVTIEPSICKEEPKDLCTMEFPKFFTPNNDSRNDFFEVMQNRCGQQGILNIYDRYGKLLFQGGLEITGWDGTYQGNNLPATDYWYRFTNTENKMPIIGHFTLKR